MRRIAILLLASYAGCMFIESYTFAGLGSVTRVVGYLAFIAGISVMVTQRGMQRPVLGHILLTLFVSFSLISVLWSVDQDMTLDHTWMFTMQLAFVWLVLQVVESQDDLNTIMAGYVIGAVLVSLANYHSFTSGQQTMLHSGRYSSTDLDPNELALGIVVAIPMSWYLGVTSDKRFRRLFFFTSLPIMVGGIILTGSRGGTLAMGMAMLIVPLCFGRISSFMKSVVFGGGIMGPLGGVTLLPESILRRLTSISSEAEGGSMAGRREIWQAGWQHFIAHPILGVGSGGFAEAISIAPGGSGVKPVAHNTYLSVATELGIIGFTIFFLAVFSMGRDILRMPKPEKWLWMTMLLGWMTGVCSLTWEHTKQTWLVFALILAAARLNESSRESEMWEIEGETTDLTVAEQSLALQ